MKKLLLFIALFYCASSFAQTPVNRSSSSVTAVDYFVKDKGALSIPVCTHTPSLNGGLDSLGSICYVKDSSSLFFRDTVLSGGHKWTRVAAGIIIPGITDSLLYAVVDSAGSQQQINLIDTAAAIRGSIFTPNLQQVTTVGNSTNNSIHLTTLTGTNVINFTPNGGSGTNIEVIDTIQNKKTRVLASDIQFYDLTEFGELEVVPATITDHVSHRQTLQYKDGTIADISDLYSVADSLAGVAQNNLIDTAAAIRSSIPAQLSGTGYSKFSGASVTYVSSIPNSDLTHSSISISSPYAVTWSGGGVVALGNSISGTLDTTLIIPYTDTLKGNGVATKSYVNSNNYWRIQNSTFGDPNYLSNKDSGNFEVNNKHLNSNLVFDSIGLAVNFSTSALNIDSANFVFSSNKSGTFTISPTVYRLNESNEPIDIDATKVRIGLDTSMDTYQYVLPTNTPTTGQVITSINNGDSTAWEDPSVISQLWQTDANGIDQLNTGGNVGINVTADPSFSLTTKSDIKVSGMTVGYGGGGSGAFNNVAIGDSALLNNISSSGINNVATGYSSQRYFNGASANTSYGSGALTGLAGALNYGSLNTAIGNVALSHDTTGKGNSALGTLSLTLNRTGNYNTAMGYYSLDVNTTGNNNIAIGDSAGYTNTTGSHNISIGNFTVLPSITLSHQLNIGNTIYGTGIDSTFSGKIGIAKTTPLYSLDVSGVASADSLKQTKFTSGIAKYNSVGTIIKADSIVDYITLTALIDSIAAHPGNTYTNGYGISNIVSNIIKVDTNLIIPFTDTLKGSGMASKFYVNSQGFLKSISTLTNGYGISGSPFNGTTPQAWIADTLSSGGLVSKLRLINNSLELVNGYNSLGLQNVTDVKNYTTDSINVILSNGSRLASLIPFSQSGQNYGQLNLNNVGNSTSIVINSQGLNYEQGANMLSITTSTLSGSFSQVFQNRSGAIADTDQIVSTGRISAGTNVTFTGSGTTASPYVISSSASGGSGINNASLDTVLRIGGVSTRAATVGVFTDNTTTTNSINLLPQVSATTAPASGNTLYDSSGFNILGSNGIDLNITKVLLTANRRDSVEDASGIIPLKRDTSTYLSTPYATTDSIYQLNRSQTTMSPFILAGDTITTFGGTSYDKRTGNPYGDNFLHTNLVSAQAGGFSNNRAQSGRYCVKTYAVPAGKSTFDSLSVIPIKSVKQKLLILPGFLNDPFDTRVTLDTFKIFLDSLFKTVLADKWQPNQILKETAPYCPQATLTAENNVKGGPYPITFARMDSFANMEKQEAIKFGIPVLDLHTITRNNDSAFSFVRFQSDSVHPTQVYQQEIAEDECRFLGFAPILNYSGSPLIFTGASTSGLYNAIYTDSLTKSINICGGNTSNNASGGQAIFYGNLNVSGKRGRIALATGIITSPATLDATISLQFGNNNVGAFGNSIGTASISTPIYTFGQAMAPHTFETQVNGVTYMYLMGDSANRAVIGFASTKADADNINEGGIEGIDSANSGGSTTGEKRIGAISFVSQGSSAGQRGGGITFFSKRNANAAGLVETMRLDSAGRLGIGTTAPTQPLTIGTATTAAKLTVDSSGNLVMINGLTSSFPSSQGTDSSIVQHNSNGNYIFQPKLLLSVKPNASVGTATLSGGTVTVSTTAVTANSKIFLTDATTGALTNVGTPTVGTVTAGTSFIINSSNVLDASNINWFIIN